MIEVKVNYWSRGFNLTMQGHAGYEEYGKDVICASASILLHTLITALERHEIKVEKMIMDGYAEVKGEGYAAVETLDVILSGFYFLEERLPDYVKLEVKILPQ